MHILLLFHKIFKLSKQKNMQFENKSSLIITIKQTYLLIAFVFDELIL